MKQAIHLGVLASANIGVSFFFQLYVLTQLGPGLQTDALFASMTIPQLALTVISSSLMHVLVPLLAGKDEERLRQDAWGFALLVGALFGLLAAILFQTATWWIPLTLPGFSETGRDLAVCLTQIQLIGMVFSAINGVQWAAYHARRRFIWAECTPLLSSILCLFLLFWALPRHGVIAAAWISVLRMLLQTLMLSPGMGRPFLPNLKFATINVAWRRIKPLLVGTTYYKTEPLIDRFLLSSSMSGSLSLYYLAQQIYGAINQVLNKAIVAPLVPALSVLYKAGEGSSFRRTFYRKLVEMLVICVFGLLILALFGERLLTLIIGHGSVSIGNVIDLWWIMVWLGGMFIGGTLGQIVSSSFYSIGDTKTPVVISIITYTLYIPAKLLVFKYYAVEGLALLTSAYYLVDFVVLLLCKRSGLRRA